MIDVFGDVHLRESDQKAKIYWEYNDQQAPKLFERIEIPLKGYAIFTGDLFDKTKHQGMVNLYAERLINAALQKYSCVVLVTGNHETSRYSGNNLALFKDNPRVFVIEDISEILTDSGVRILACPHIEGISMAAYNQRLIDRDIQGHSGADYYDLVVGHHYFEENAVMRAPHLDIDGAGLTYNHWVMGHNHKFEKISDKKWCVGSWWACNKGEREYDFHYVNITDGKAIPIPIPKNLFSQFVVVPWGQQNPEIEVASTDFALVQAACKQAEKTELEHQIREWYRGQLYDIEWKLEEEIKDESVEVKTDNDLVRLFFEEEKVSAAVRDKAMAYLQGATR